MTETTYERARPWLDRGPEVVFDETVPADDRATAVSLLGSWDPLPFVEDVYRVRCLVGGANNRNYVLDSGRRRFVLRIASPQADRLAVDRASAIQAQRDAAAVQVAPAVISARLPEGHVLSTFVDGAVVREAILKDRDMVRRVGALLARLHAAPTTCRRFSAFDDIRHWIALARADGTELAMDVPDLLELVERAERCVVAARLPTAFCHNDTVPQNFIRTADSVCLVDWDFAGRGWAAFELAAFANTAALDQTLLDELLDAYCGEASDAQRAMIGVLSLVAAVREVAWAYMATPMLKGTTTLMDGWTYEAFLDDNLQRARVLAGIADYDEMLEQASADAGRAW